MKCPTFQELRCAYIAAARLGDIRAAPDTARKNFNELLGIAAACGIRETDSLSKLSAQALRIWRAREYARAGLVAPDPHKNYLLNCRIRQAQSVFSKSAAAAFESAGIKIPQSASAFARAAKFQPEARQTFRPIPRQTDEAIRRAARGALEVQSLPALSGRGSQSQKPRENEAPGLSPLCAVMIEMARLAGLTAKEIHHFRRSWVVDTSGGLCIDVREGDGFYTKRASKSRQIPIAPEVWARWQKFLPPDGRPPFGEYGRRTSPESVYSQACRFLRPHLPGRKKRLHELRKMACSEVLARERDIYAASYFIGDRVDTTAKYYAAQIRRIRPLE